MDGDAYEPLLVNTDKESEKKDSIKDDIIHAINALASERPLSFDASSITIEKEESKKCDTPGEKRSHSSLGRLLRLLKTEWGTIFVATIALAISTTSQLAQPYFFGRIILVSTSNDDSSTRISELNKYTFVLLVILLIGGLAAMVRGWLYTLVGERLVRSLRSTLFTKIVELDISFFDSNKSGELMNRLSSDTTVIQNCLSVNISMGLRAAAEIVVSIAFLFITSWRLTLVMIAVIPLLVLVAVLYGRFTKRLTREYQDALAGAAESGAESIMNSRIMKSFGAEEWEGLQYKLNVEKAYRKGATKAFAYGVFAGGIGFFAGLAILVVIYYGSTLVIDNEINVGDLTAFIFYTLYIAIDLGIFSGLYTEFMNAVGASERIFDIMDMVPAIPVRSGEWPADCQGFISFDKVTFKYPSRSDVTVLKDFNLVIKPNQTVALVGASGSGKSTVLCLLERFYDVSTGSISIDGVDIRRLDPRWLHRNIAIVPQEPVLFSGTIFSNITYALRAARPELPVDAEVATLAEVEAVGKQANAHDFIMSFPEGYLTTVGERGVRLSGGQKQRVAIARALLAAPRILLLDEATSALDSESEVLVQEAIGRLMQNRTVIVVAHRLSTIRDADVIGVFGTQGGLVAAGRHEELLRNCPTYANLVRKQLGGDKTIGEYV